MFKVLGPFKRRLTGQEDEHLLKVGVSFLYTDNDICWYSLATKYPEPELYKIMVDANNKVCAMSTDITMLYPMDCTVIITDSIPAAMKTSEPSLWRLVGKTFEPDYSAAITQAERRKLEALRVSSIKVDTLRDAINSELATDDEKRLFKAWTDYRIKVNRLDTKLGSAMTLPVSPE